MIGYGDNFGTGFPEMVEVWENAWGEKPVLNERYELQIVELSFGGMKRDNPPINSENPPVNSENPPVNMSLDDIILLGIQSNPWIKYDELAQKTRRHRDTIRTHIKLLKEKGLLVRVGSKKDGYWQVIDGKEGEKDA